jgi:hypothetical protein
MSELPPPTWPYQPSFGLRRIAGVGTALSVMMFIAAGLAALAAFARFNRYSVVQDVMDGKVDSFSSTVADADDMVATFAGMLRVRRHCSVRVAHHLDLQKRCQHA